MKNIPFKKYISRYDKQKTSQTDDRKHKNKANEQRTWKFDKMIENFNFFNEHVKQMKQNQKYWKKKYGSYSPSDIKQFYKLIKNNFIKIKDNPIKKLNKLLIWISFLHSSSSLFEFSCQWKLNEQTIKNYIVDVLFAILLTYKNDKGIIKVPDFAAQHLMHKILINKNEDLVESLLYLDGTHKLTVGRNDINKRSWKFKWRPAWSHLFVIDRIFGMILSVNIGNPARKHDITILNESNFGINFDHLLDELYFCLADNAYYGFNKKNFCAMPKKTSDIYKLLDKDFIYKHKKCRVNVEHLFARFFVNQNIRLNNWTLKGQNALKLLNCNLICSIILWNQTKLWKAKSLCV